MARSGADKGDLLLLPEDACSTRNAEWHPASVNYAPQNVAYGCGPGACCVGMRAQTRQCLRRALSKEG
jgi:hypothetical protein